jgi:hypothetical protein
MTSGSVTVGSGTAERGRRFTAGSHGGDKWHWGWDVQSGRVNPLTVSQEGFHG